MNKGTPKTISPTRNTLDAGANILTLSPGRLISLWEMIKFSISEFGQSDFLVEWMRRDFYTAASISGGNGKVSDKDKQRLLAKLADVRRTCELLELNSSVRQLSHIEQEFQLSAPPLYIEIATLLHGLWHSIASEVGDRHFVFIPPNKAEFFEKDNLFGGEVDSKFSDANYDIKEAGNCIAADLNSAAVFHLMRVAEYGLRALAKQLKVRIKKKPLEYAEWGEIISQIETKVATLKRRKRSKRKAELLELYHGVLGEFNAFKDVWRNNIMHTRRNYNEHEALGVLLHVRGFMQRLACGVSEPPTESA